MLDLLLRQHQDARHARRRRIGGRLHRLATLLHNTQTIFKGHRPGKHESRVLTKTQPGGHLAPARQVRHLSLHLFQTGQARHVNRGLADGRGVQAIGGPVLADFCQVVSEDFAGPCIQRSCGWIGLGDLLPHSNVLGALTGEEKSDACHKRVQTEGMDGLSHSHRSDSIKLSTGGHTRVHSSSFHQLAWEHSQ